MHALFTAQFKVQTQHKHLYGIFLRSIYFPFSSVLIEFTDCLGMEWGSLLLSLNSMEFIHLVYHFIYEF